MQDRTLSKTGTLGAGLAAIMMLAGTNAEASSHREAPFITENPKVDATDFYMFRSYEAGRRAYVTFLANYYPLQDPFGGPNYFNLDDNALYEIHIDNDADAVEDITFQFQFQTNFQNIEIPVGTGADMRTVSVPVYNAGPVDMGMTDALNVSQTYSVTMVEGDRRTGTRRPVMSTQGNATFTKPADNVGMKSFPNYENYAQAQIATIDIPGCASPGRVFVGQRNDPFVVNLGQIFDLLNADLAALTGATNCDAAPEQFDDLNDKNVTTFALEVPIDCLTNGTDPVIGAWTTASLRQARVLDPTPTFASTQRVGGAWTQVSRLGHPLVNEVVIGLEDKNMFNASEPSGDTQFIDYVTNPTLPELVELIFPAAGPLAPDVFPRADLVEVFLQGVDGLNRPTSANQVPSEQLRLNTMIEATDPAGQSALGVLGGDTAGFPNGRRPIDDVVDIELRVLFGALLDAGPDVPARDVPLTDCAPTSSETFLNTFPYASSPLPGNAIRVDGEE